MSQSIPQSVIQNKQLTIQLSKQEVMLSASQTLDRFEVTVYNDSDRFASFQLKLLAAGIQAETHSNSWYRLTPSVSSKIPAGDCTHFQVEIFELPPIAQQFRGSIDLTVEVTSRELQNQYDRKSLRLLVKSLQTEPPKITLTIPPEVNPSESLRILAQVYNPTTVPVELLLRLQGLPESWFSKGIQQAITLPGEKLEWVTFEGEVPPPLQTLSYDYPVQLEVTGRFPIVVVPGRIQILPAGQLLFSCDRSEGSIPEPLGRWQNPAQGIAEFILQVDNQSNLEPDLNITVQDVTLKRRMFWQKNIEPHLILPGEFPPGVTIGESPATLTSRNQEIPLQIQRSLPWLGWARLHRFEIGMTSTDPLIAVEPDRQIIQLHLFPRIPFWLQILGALLALGLGALAWLFLIDPGHRGPVTSLKFNGQGTEILSGSDDQTLRRWRVQDQNFQTHSRMNDFNKAIRVTRYRPVNNDQIAIGFENGEIQLANLLTGERSRLTPDKDDRVLDIIFSRDARTLYSGHGSGLVLQWDMTLPNSQQSTPKTAYNTQFAIQTMALVGKDDHILAIAGRYNRIVFLNTQQISPPQKNIPKKSKIQNPKSRIPGNLTPSSIVAQPSESEPSQPEETLSNNSASNNSTSNNSTSNTAFIEIPYATGQPTDYISSLSIAEQQPSLLAIADNQGYISLWDSQQCMNQQGRCGPFEPRWLGHSGSPVRSVALSASGCFMASVADDGEVKIWSFDKQGSKLSSAMNGRVLDRIQHPLNTVDIIQTRNGLLVTSGGQDGKVRLHRVPFANEKQPTDYCPILAGGDS